MPTQDLPFNALQISMRSLHFDRITTPVMWGYVVGVAQRNLNESGQLYVSAGSFKVRRDFRLRTQDDEVFRWDGEGEIVLSTPLAGLDSIGLDLYFIRDNRRLREIGGIFGDLFQAKKGGQRLANELTAAVLGKTSATGVLVGLVPEVLGHVGSILQERGDRVKIRGDGTLNVRDLLTQYQAHGDPDGISPTQRWGKNRADKGYFEIDCEFVTLSDPTRHVVTPQLPPDLLAALR